MSHSLPKIWIHAVWATKHRAPLISASVEEKVYQYITQELEAQGCRVKIVNGMPDHVHCLFLLNAQKSIADVIRQTKGSSSHEINLTDLTRDKFSWQTGYAAFSVSRSMVEKVFKYISEQKTHHQKKTFQQEYDHFLKLVGLDEPMV